MAGMVEGKVAIVTGAGCTHSMAKESNPDGRLHASGVGYVVFAVENPMLFQLMFNGDAQASSGNAALNKSRDTAYGVLQAAVADTSGRRRGSSACLSKIMGAGAWHRQVDC
jgi:hypothetical protein